MIYEFEYQEIVGGEWEPIGAADGDGKSEIGDAFRSLPSRSGGGADGGTHRARQAGTDERWESFTLDGGEILHFL